MKSLRQGCSALRLRTIAPVIANCAAGRLGVFLVFLFQIWMYVDTYLFHVTPRSFMEFDVDVVWMWMFVGVLTLTCGLHMRLLHCLCHGGWGWVGGGAEVANHVQCLLRSEVML